MWLTLRLFLEPSKRTVRRVSTLSPAASTNSSSRRHISWPETKRAPARSSTFLPFLTGLIAVDLGRVDEISLICFPDWN
jgi:hypothetical protein